jgi:hypothetical protein
MDFPRLFPGCRIVKLEENYRSTQPILDLANAVIAGAREKYTKCLFSRKADGDRPRLFRTASENEQSRLVVSQVEDLKRQGIPLKEMAVLVRAGYHSFDLEIELTRAGIHFVKFGGFKFVESAHIKDILAYLRVLANPRDGLSWHRLLLLVPGVGRQSCARFDAGLANNFTLEAALGWIREQQRPSHPARHIHEGGFSVVEGRVVRPNSLSEVNLQAPDDSGEQANRHGGQHDVPFGILHFLSERGDAIEPNIGQRGIRCRGPDNPRVECLGIIKGLERENPRPSLEMEKVADSQDHEDSDYHAHDGE